MIDIFTIDEKIKLKKPDQSTMEIKNEEPVEPPDPDKEVTVKRKSWMATSLGNHESVLHKFQDKDTTVLYKDTKLVSLLNVRDSIRWSKKVNSNNKK